MCVCVWVDGSRQLKGTQLVGDLLKWGKLCGRTMDRGTQLPQIQLKIPLNKLGTPYA